MSNADKAVQDLLSRRNLAQKNIKGWKAVIEAADKELVEILGAESILKEAGKLEDGGSKTVKQHGGKFVVEAAKKIKWDSKLLQNVAAELPWKTVAAIFKIKFEVPEKVYTQMITNTEAGLFPSETLASIDEARTVAIGEPKIKSAEFIEE